MDTEQASLFEERLCGDPYNKNLWLEYAQFLLKNRDPRGRWIFQEYRDPAYDDDEPFPVEENTLSQPCLNILNQNRSSWLDEIVSDYFAEEEISSIIWKHGYIWKVFLGLSEHSEHNIPVEHVYQRLLETHALKFLFELRMGRSSDLKKLLAVVKKGTEPLSMMRRLVIGDYSYEERFFARHLDIHAMDYLPRNNFDIGRVKWVFDKMPNLRHLKLYGKNIDLKNTSHDELIELVIKTNAKATNMISQLRSADFPKLQRLSVELNGVDNTEIVQSLLEYLNSANLSNLIVLNIFGNGGSFREILGAVHKLPIRKQLSSFTSTYSYGDVRWFESNFGKFNEQDPLLSEKPTVSEVMIKALDWAHIT